MLSHIRRVDIEFHSFCNRRCIWCPNTDFIRDDEDIEMSDELYSKIINELKDNNFGKYPRFPLSENRSPKDSPNYSKFIINQPVLSFLGYQEPLSNIPLLKKRVQEAWEKLPPHIELVSNTNGDYLTEKSLDGLLLTTLNIKDYDSKGMEYWKERLKKLGVLIIDIDENIEQIIGVHKNVGNVTCYCNWPKHIDLEDRGGFLKKEDIPDIKWRNNAKERTEICLEPSYYINIHYNGDIMPCCHLRMDNPMHKEFILGNVNNNTLVEIHNNEKANNLKEILSIEDGNFPSTCLNCQKIRQEGLNRFPS